MWVLVLLEPEFVFSRDFGGFVLTGGCGMGPCPEVKIEETPEVWLYFLIKPEANPRKEDRLLSRQGLSGSQEYIPLKSHRRLALLPSLTKPLLVLPWFSLH